MTDRQKRERLREILADSKGAIAPGVTDPMFARLAALSAVREMLFELKDTGHGAGLFQASKRCSGGGALVQGFGYAQAMTCSRLAWRSNAT